MAEKHESGYAMTLASLSNEALDVTRSRGYRPTRRCNTHRVGYGFGYSLPLGTRL